MRQSAQLLSSANPPQIGIAVDGVTGYGRAVLRGVLRYANLQRKWLIHKDMWARRDSAVEWPRCDGTIIAGVEFPVHQEIVAASRYAVTCSGSYDPNQIPVVALDDDATGHLAADHLLHCGMKNFAFYGPREAREFDLHQRPMLMSARRARGFQVALKSQGFSCHYADLLWPGQKELLTHAHHEELIAWLKTLPKPIGIFAVDDIMAHDLAAACLEAGITVPEEIAIIGVNNDDLFCESAWPPLSSIEADFSRMGYHAARLLDRMLSGHRLSRQERLTELPPLRVVQRMSTNVLATSSPDLVEALRLIREHACDPCTVDDVLRRMTLTRRNLERQFTRHLGRSPHDEIARVRLETARRLLLQPDLGIPEIADRCGFSAVQSFNRFFRQQVGVTPAVFRRQAV